MSTDLRAMLSDAERERVDFLNDNLTRKPADEFQSGEYLKLEGSQRLGRDRWMQRGVYCVLNWRRDGLELMRYGSRERVQVPFTWEHGEAREFTKVPLELVVLSERAKEREAAHGH